MLVCEIFCGKINLSGNFLVKLIFHVKNKTNKVLIQKALIYFLKKKLSLIYHTEHGYDKTLHYKHRNEIIT